MVLSLDARIYLKGFNKERHKGRKFQTHAHSPVLLDVKYLIDRSIHKCVLVRNLSVNLITPHEFIRGVISGSRPNRSGRIGQTYNQTHGTCQTYNAINFEEKQYECIFSIQSQIRPVNKSNPAMQKLYVHSFTLFSIFGLVQRDK
jgi:hypothetical protein